MNCQRGLRAGILVLLVLSGCSKNKTLNVEGAYTPVIVNLRSDHEPPVRDAVNALTAEVSNPRGYAIEYHWSTAAGNLTDSTSATAHWTPPPAIGIYAVTVSIVAHDPDNGVDFFKTRTFQLYVDNKFVRWTRSIAIQSDVVPPTAGRIFYTEIRNSVTSESDVWALAAPLGSPEQITRDFWTTTAPTTQSDGSMVAFLGKKKSTDGGASIWQVPGSGGDTASASIVVRWTQNSNHFIGPPRFAPSGSMVAYASDTLSFNFNRPKLWSRDAGNMAVAPVPMQPTTAEPGSFEVVNTYWNQAWNGSDSVVAESYTGFEQPSRQFRGFYKFAAVGSPPINPPDNPEPFAAWLNDVGISEPDWSPNGQYIVFAKRLPGRLDRDLFIINAHASNPSAAVPVTSGPADEYHPRFAGNDSTVFFLSNRVDGYGANGFHDTERRGVNIWSVTRIDRP